MKQKEILQVIPPKEIIVGTPKAPLKLVMFGDYESEATAKASITVQELLDRFEGKVSFVFRHFPLTRVHQKAHKAAEAAIGASQEGKFWEMHQILMQHRMNLGVISLKSYAREAGVKDKKFLDHLINGDWGWYVQDDLREGLSKGVTEIPALFVNGERFTKEITVKNLLPLINDILEAEEPKAQRKRA
jgi:protein-disulfide isomerase